MKKALRISAVFAVVVAAGLYLFGQKLLDHFAGNFADPPLRVFGAPAQKLIDAAYAGVDPARMLDHHVHLAGIGAGGTGATANEHMFQWWHPREVLKLRVYMSAAGVHDISRADQRYLERLDSLIDAMPHPYRALLLGFEAHRTRDGTRDEENTELFIPNEYVFDVVAKHPDGRYLPMVSIHPYRKDALIELQRAREQGARYIKWLPNAMNIDPCKPGIAPFYEAMRKLGMILLTHAGEEKAVNAEEFQRLGNPLRLRRALDHGVRVVVAHCASLGQNEDLDHRGTSRDNWELFLRLMDEYPGLAFGEISATVLYNRAPNVLPKLLARKDLFPRLVNGTDYPLPAIDALIRVGGLADAGLVSEGDVDALNEIYTANPLLFDFVLKRTVGFPSEIFYENEAVTSTAAVVLRDDLPPIDDECARASSPAPEGR